MWDIIQMVESIILPVGALLICDRGNYSIRAMFFGITIFNVCSLLQYILLLTNPEYFYITTIIFICVIVPYLYRYVLESLRPITHKYCAKKCFVVYKRPSTIVGTICSLLTAPYGHCSLVINGVEFAFKCGVVVERKFKMKNNLTFIEIHPLGIDEARALIGRRWSLKNNCFTTFASFRNVDYK
jgi:hypothetical protein